MKHLILLIIIAAFISCKKAENRRCFKAAGCESSINVNLPNFDKLVLKKGIEYILVQDNSNYLTIKGGKNLINFIGYDEIEEQKIQIENKNKCNFLRKYSHKISVEIHFTSLSEIRYEGTKTLHNLDTLQFNNFRFEVIDACGTFNLLLKANKITADIPYGFGDYNLSGMVNEADLSVKSNGYCDTRNLVVKNRLKVDNESTGDMYINTNGLSLLGKISNSGNIYYQGDLFSDSLFYYSSGKLIKL